jgi:hypothetical protein
VLAFDSMMHDPELTEGQLTPCAPLVASVNECDAGVLERANSTAPSRALYFGHVSERRLRCYSTTGEALALSRTKDDGDQQQNDNQCLHTDHLLSYTTKEVSMAKRQ